MYNIIHFFAKKKISPYACHSYYLNFYVVFFCVYLFFAQFVLNIRKHLSPVESELLILLRFSNVHINEIWWWQVRHWRKNSHTCDCFFFSLANAMDDIAVAVMLLVLIVSSCCFFPHYTFNIDYNMIMIVTTKLSKTLI